jgi:hypothetical protein
MSKLCNLKERVKNMAQKSYKHPRISLGGGNLKIWSSYKQQASTKHVIGSKKSTLINIKHNINIVSFGGLYESDTTPEAFSETTVQKIHYFVETLRLLPAHA